MAAKVGSLLIDISTNVAKVASDMGKVTKGVQGAAAKMKRSIASLKRAAAAMFTGLVLHRGVQFAEQLIDNADAMSKLAAKTGVTVETLSAFGHAAELSGANIGILSKGFKTLAANANDAASGTGEAKKAFDELGISVSGADGNLKSLDMLMLESAQAISALEDSTKQAALSSDIFGRAGFELLPMLKQGKAGIKAMTEEADRLGISISTEFAENSAAFNDELTKMKGAFEGLVRAGLPDIVKDVTVLATAMTDVAMAAKGFNDTDTGKFVSWLNSLANPLTHALNAYKELKGLLEEGPQIGDDAGTGDLLSGFLSDAEDAKTRGVAYSKSLTDGLVAGYESAKVDDAIVGLLDSTALMGFEEDMRGLARATELINFDDLMDTEALTDFTDEMDTLTESWDKFADVTVEKTNIALESTGSIVGNLTRQISNFANGAKVDFTAMTQSILNDMLKVQAQKFLTGIVGNLFGGGGDSNASGNTPAFPFGKFAKGGVVSQPTMALAGEAGTEAFFPLDTKGGKLGISGSDSGSKTNITIINNSPAKIETSQSNDGGIENIVMLIKDTVNGGVYEGDFSSSLGQMYGLEMTGTKR